MANILTCIICGKPTGVRSTVKHRNSLLGDGFVICKNCVNTIAVPENKDGMISICQLMNIPYVEHIIRSTFKEPNQFTEYLKVIALSKKYTVFKDSVFEDTIDNQSDNFEITEKIIEKWGSGYSEDDYHNFEVSLNRLIGIKVPSTQFELMRYITNVKLESALNESLKVGDHKAITALRKSYAEDLKDLGMDSILNAKDDGTETLGERIKKWEDHEPVPSMKELDDVENIKEYIRKWFVIPMKRVFGIANEDEVSELYEDD